MNKNKISTGKTKPETSTQKLPIYELAKELGLANKDLLQKIQSLGIDAKNHLSRIEPGDVEKVRKFIENPQSSNVLSERLSTTVIRRRAKVTEQPVVSSPPIEVAHAEDEIEDVIPELISPVEQEHVEIPFVLEQKIEMIDSIEEALIESEETHELLTDEEIPENDDFGSVIEPVETLEIESTQQEEFIPTVVKPSETSKVSSTRRNYTGLGPTGRVIDLSAFRTAAPPAVETKENSNRGPRQEVSGERIRNFDRNQPPSKQQTKSRHQQQAQQQQQQQPAKKIAKSTLLTTAAEHKRVVKMGEAIVVKDLANQMGLKATDLLKKVWELGLRSVMINSSIDFDTAQLVASEFEWKVETNLLQEADVFLEKDDFAVDLIIRAPVVTIMGHVDHGKTSLLDAIRNANVAGGEAGGITQHIGAYKIAGPAGDVVFLDTPGHEAFTEMRARGAQATDIVVLVVAADDGVMPQTIEALNHAKDAKVPIIVAVNKIDKPGAQPDRIRQQLAIHDLNPEEWGGTTIYVDVSAKTRVGIDKLLEMLALQAEVLELRANPKKASKGIVIEARMDAKRGAVATVLVQDGTLNIGDSVVVGEELGKIRAMTDDKGRTIIHAPPSTPVEVLGLSGVPRAGDTVNAVADEKAAKTLVELRRQKRVDTQRAKIGPVTLDKLMDAMRAGLKELKIILKADVQGSAEALTNALQKLSNSQVKVTVIQAAVGGITESDVNLAKAGNAIIIGFHVRPAGKTAAFAEQEGVEIKLYDIIYEALDDIKKATAGLLDKVKREKILGKAEIRETFNIPKIGTVAGAGVIDGLLKRNAQVRLIRDSVLIYTGKLASLRRFKDDVREVQQGYECGFSLEGYNDLKVSDIVECFEIEEVAQTLQD